ncbi:MAG: hypothetical protein AAFX53_10390 [Bacteroidota bacterium]
MIASQRKAHKFIWLGIAIVIPILLFFVIRNLDISPAQTTVKGDKIVAKKVGKTVEIKLGRSFVSPSAVVYELNPDGDPEKVLGQLKGAGDYSFEASKGTLGIRVVDEIKKEELFKIEF